MQWRNLKGGFISSYNKKPSSVKPNGIHGLDSILTNRNSIKWEFPVTTRDNNIPGTLWVWGMDNYLFNRSFSTTNSMTSDGITYGKSSPTQVGVATNWVSVSSGQHHGGAIRSDGTLWMWGRNAHGATTLGSVGADAGQAFKTLTPTQIGTLTNWAKVSCAIYMTAAVKTDGTLWVWGRNAYGQLGLGNTTNYSSPKQVGVLTNWLDVIVSGNSTFAIKTDGTLWVWGRNAYGQLGLGNTTNYSSPKQVGTRTDWKQISIGTNDVIFGLTASGSMWTWGGNLSVVDAPLISGGVMVPTPIFTDSRWNVLANKVGDTQSSYSNMAAIKSDGTLWVWGRKNEIIPTLSTFNSSLLNIVSPVQVGSRSDWIDVTLTRPTNALALRSDGTLWAWGKNTYGGLGLNNTTSYSSPKQIGAATNWRKVVAGGRHTFAIRN